MNNIEEKIVSIICKQIKITPDQLKLDLNPIEEHNIDSLDFVEMLIEIEEEFGIDLKSSPTKEVKSVRDLINEVESALKEKNS